MNILEKRKIQSDLYDIVKNLEIFQITLNLVGSASIASQLHYSDYDFNCKIKVRKQTLIFNALFYRIQDRIHRWYKTKN